MSASMRSRDLAHALRGFNISLRPAETHALVGESGSGKTVTSMCIMGLLATPPGRVNRGKVIFQNRDLLQLSENQRRKVRGKRYRDDLPGTRQISQSRL